MVGYITVLLIEKKTEQNKNKQTEQKFNGKKVHYRPAYLRFLLPKETRDKK